MQIRTVSILCASGVEVRSRAEAEGRRLARAGLVVGYSVYGRFKRALRFSPNSLIRHAVTLAHPLPRKPDGEDRSAIIASRFHASSMALGDFADNIQAKTHA
jgi:hypothetical protein